MKKTYPYNYLKKYREQAQYLLQDMASIIGISNAGLSKIEKGEVRPSIDVILIYHFILNIPITTLFNKHVRLCLRSSIERSQQLREKLMDEKGTPAIYSRLDMLDIISERLNELSDHYE